MAKRRSCRNGAEATILRRNSVSRPHGVAPALAAVLLACTACSASVDADPAVEQVGEQMAQPRLGLMSTLPIYWNEAVEFSDLLNQDQGANWVRTVLERDYALEPLDVLRPETLAPLDRLILAQPRALSPEENVALDDWVRNGGRVIVFADPMLTRHSEYRLGDPRRPHDVALLSPILARWGLELEMDTSQGDEERVVDAFGMSVPVRISGTFAARDAGGEAECTLSDTRLMARCTIGKGGALLIADAAILDEDDEHAGPHAEDKASAEHSEHRIREAALTGLLESGFEG